MKLRTVAVWSALLLGTLAARSVDAQSVLTSEQAKAALSLENVEVRRDQVSGVIVNKTPHMIRDVQLVLQYHWLWKNERNPGTDSPGRTVILRFNEQLEPGKPHRFVFTPDFQLASRSDGWYMPENDIGGFTAVIQPQSFRQSAVR